MTNEPVPAGRERATVVAIGDELLVCDDISADLQCTARTRKGLRCKNPIDYGQIAGWVEVMIPGVGEVAAYDLRRRGDLTARWRAQRCETHWPGGESAVEPEWRRFDPVVDVRPVRVLPVRRLAWVDGRVVWREFTPCGGGCVG